MGVDTSELSSDQDQVLSARKEQLAIIAKGKRKLSPEEEQALKKAKKEGSAKKKHELYLAPPKSKASDVASEKILPRSEVPPEIMEEIKMGVEHALVETQGTWERLFVNFLGGQDKRAAMLSKQLREKEEEMEKKELEQKEKLANLEANYSRALQEVEEAKEKEKELLADNARTKGQLSQQSGIMSQQSGIISAVVEKLLTTGGFSQFMKEVNGVSFDWVRSFTLEHVAEAYGVATRRAAWKWHPQAEEKARKEYAQKMLHSSPQFPLLQYLAELGRPITLEEAQHLTVDHDSSLERDANLVIADTFVDLDVEEGESDEERAEPEAGIENSGGQATLGAEDEGIDVLDIDSSVIGDQSAEVPTLNTHGASVLPSNPEVNLD